MCRTSELCIVEFFSCQRKSSKWKFVIEINRLWRCSFVRSKFRNVRNVGREWFLWIISFGGLSRSFSDADHRISLTTFGNGERKKSTWRSFLKLWHDIAIYHSYSRHSKHFHHAFLSHSLFHAFLSTVPICLMSLSRNQIIIFFFVFLKDLMFLWNTAIPEGFGNKMMSLC